MNCKEWRERLRAWLLDALERESALPEPPAELREHAEECRDCGARLDAALITLNPETAPRPTEELPRRVKARVRERADAREAGRFGPGGPGAGRSGRVARERFGSRRLVRFATAAALLAVAVLSGALLAGLIPGASGTRHADGSDVAEGRVAPDTDERVVRVELRLEAPNARRVSVVGDWNAWDTAADPLRDPDDDGVWETTITLRPNEEYQYQFLIDGQTWIPDPSSALTVDDGFGGKNSVLDI